MKRSISLLFLLIISTFYFGQEQLTAIPGSKFSLVPPKGFVISPTFSGFQNEATGSSIIAVDLPTSYSELVKGLTKETLQAQGMKLLSKENIKFNNGNATLFKVSQSANGTEFLKQILVFGDQSKTLMVNGIYPKTAINIEKEIYNSLLTVKFDENKENKPLEAANFTIDVEETGYQFVKSIAGAYLYSEDGKIPSDSGLIIVSSSLGKFSTTDEKQTSIERLKTLPNADRATIKKMEKIKISDLEGYEIIAEDNDKHLIYQTMLFAPNQYFLIVGQAKNDEAKNLEIFRKVAKTFKLK